MVFGLYYYYQWQKRGASSRVGHRDHYFCFLFSVFGSLVTQQSIVQRATLISRRRYAYTLLVVLLLVVVFEGSRGGTWQGGLVGAGRGNVFVL